MFTIDLRSYTSARLFRGRRSARTRTGVARNASRKKTWSTVVTERDNRRFGLGEALFSLSLSLSLFLASARLASGCNKSRCDVVSYLARSSYVNRGYITSSSTYAAPFAFIRDFRRVVCTRRDEIGRVDMTDDWICITAVCFEKQRDSGCEILAVFRSNGGT